MRTNRNQFRDDLANSLRGTLLVIRPKLRCPSDEEAEAIANCVIKFLDREMLIDRAELNEALLETFRTNIEELRHLRYRYNSIVGAINSLIEAKTRIDEIFTKSNLNETSWFASSPIKT